VVFNWEDAGGVDVLAILVTVTVVVFLIAVIVVTSELDRSPPVWEAPRQLPRECWSPGNHDPVSDTAGMLFCPHITQISPSETDPDGGIDWDRLYAG
jgi:hypothetical protein